MKRVTVGLEDSTAPYNSVNFDLSRAVHNRRDQSESTSVRPQIVPDERSRRFRILTVERFPPFGFRYPDELALLPAESACNRRVVRESNP